MQTVTQLINQFIPDNYQLSINLHRVERSFDGIVTIHGVSSNPNSITLHSKDLHIKSAIVDGKKTEFSYGDDNALVITHPDLIAGEHMAVITFSGKITDSMHGLYPCYYEHEGVKKELLATQFESHHAREVFPCVDEPAAKATFDVTLTTEPDVTVLGNMPVRDQRNENGNLVTTFETTPKMSSYLLAWVVGEMHKKSGVTNSGVEVNIWSTPAQPINNLDFALDIAIRSVEFFDEYFDTPYPLPKCDHVALPDFSSGAMENWGLITYREIALLVDPITTSISSKHYAATVIAHELSHQWFGNLVTMKWWNDLWLNESFATLVEYIAIDALEPSWNVWLDFASFETLVALRRDSLDGVQSVQTDVHHPDEISTLFDGAIVYAKGARLLKMLQNYIGDQAFQAGLKNYFKIHAYQNTEAVDLWQALSEASGKDIASFMNRWIAQPGFPILRVSENDNQILLSQERLTCNADKISEVLWPITLNSSWLNMPELFDTRSIEVPMQSHEPLRFNVGNNAHFITHYSPNLLARIIEQLKSGILLPIDRLQILNEQTLLARAGIISSAELIPLLDAYKDEDTEPVWNIIAMAIGELKKFVEDDADAEQKLRALASSLARVQYTRLGWTTLSDEQGSDTKLRGIVASLMVYGEDPEAIATATNLYNSTTLDNLNPELRGLILSVVVRYASDNTVVDPLLDAYKKTDSAELKQDICIGLTATKNETVILQLLEMVKDTSTIRTQDTARWIIYLMRNKYAKVQTWQWIRDNWNWIKLTFGGDKSYDDYPRYTASTLSTPVQLGEYHDFFTPLQSDPTLSRAIEMGINEIQNRVDSIAKDGPAVRQALINL